MAEVRTISKDLFGDMDYGNLLRVFYVEFSIDEFKENGYLVRPKGKKKISKNQYYFKKSKNIQLL
jgi:hypothetical protein